MKPNLFTLLIPLLIATSTLRSHAEEDPRLTQQVSDILKETAKIKPGITREELLKTYTTEGGISTAARRTFVHQRCSLIKVNVEFILTDKKDLSNEQASDKISKISKPYLDWNIID